MAGRNKRAAKAYLFGLQLGELLWGELTNKNEARQRIGSELFGIIRSRRFAVSIEPVRALPKGCLDHQD
jgi:hypothetical protein